MSILQFVRVFIAVLFFTSLLGCTEKPEADKDVTKKEELPSESIKRGGIYKTTLSSEITTLDPARVKDIYSETLIHQLFDRLVKFGPYLQVSPALAETWTIDKTGTRYKFILRKNARFHNGEPVTSADAAFSISRLLRVSPQPEVLPHLLKIQGAREYQKGNSETVTGLEVVNDQTFQITLEAPHSPFLTALGMNLTSIIQKVDEIQLNAQPDQHPVGSGPFYLESWDKGRSIRLTRFADYYDGPAYLDGIHYTIYPSDQYDTAVENFQRGALDEIPVLGGQVREKLSGMTNLQWFHRPSLSLFFYGFNCEHPLLKNPDVRKALSMVIDRQRLVETVYGGQFTSAKTILPPGMPAYQPKDRVNAGDVDAARQLIHQAVGEVPPSTELEIVSSRQSPRVEAELNLIREYWGQLGISVQLKYITDWSQYEAYLGSNSVQVYRYAWFADMPDPDSFFHPLFSSTSTVNFMQFNNKEVDQQLAAARELTDPIGRGKMYHQLEDRIMALSPLAPLFYLSVDRVYQPYVQGAQPSALGAHTMPLHRVWLKKQPIPQTTDNK